jgi:hypothetical protein
VEHDRFVGDQSINAFVGDTTNTGRALAAGPLNLD